MPPWCSVPSASVVHEIVAHTPTRYAAAPCTEARLIGIVEEGQVVGSQPGVMEDDICVAVHVDFHGGSFLVEAAEDQLGHQGPPLPVA